MYPLVGSQVLPCQVLKSALRDLSCNSIWYFRYSYYMHFLGTVAAEALYLQFASLSLTHEVVYTFFFIHPVLSIALWPLNILFFLACFEL